MIVDALRTTLHRVLSTNRGDAFTAVRVTKEIARGFNSLVGEPICSADEIAKRRAAQSRLESLRGKSSTEGLKREASPVMVYFEKDRNHRMLERVEQTLAARNIVYKKLDVTGDANTKSFVMREAKCEEDELPIVFVAGVAVGGLDALVAADVSGKLMKAVSGT